jgi:CRISPR system Cascade subunit CasB
VESKKHRAWPALNRLGIAVSDRIGAAAAGLFATHPEEVAYGNVGTTCKAIERSRGHGDGGTNDKESKLTPTERRFQHLLAAESGEELLDRVTRMVLMAKAQGIPVNYAQLESDIRRWTQFVQQERVREEWAAEFWTPGSETNTATDISRGIS